MKKEFKDLAKIPGTDGRADMQYWWYDYFYHELMHRTVLDVGSGISDIKNKLASIHAFCTTQEPQPDCPADTHDDLGSLLLLPKRYDVVTCFDVIEHVKFYGALIRDMAALAKKYVIVTTPGVQVTGNTNPYHWHEFEPDELIQLFEAAGMFFRRSVFTRHDEKGHIGNGNEEFPREFFLDNPRGHPMGFVFRKTLLP